MLKLALYGSSGTTRCSLLAKWEPGRPSRLRATTRRAAIMHRPEESIATSEVSCSGPDDEPAINYLGNGRLELLTCENMLADSGAVSGEW